MVMYAQENAGFLPPVRLSTPYTVGAIKFDKGGPEVLGKSVDENVKWWHFLGKYLTKKSSMAQTGEQMASFMSRFTILVPIIGGYSDGTAANVLNGANRNFTGVGMNCWPSLRPDYPASAAGQRWFPAGEGEVLGLHVQRSGQGNVVQALAVHPAGRAGAARRLAAILPGSQEAAGGAADSRTAVDLRAEGLQHSVNGQVMHDFYRHGTYPPVQDGNKDNGYFKPTGGKVSYNILYADNHVITAVPNEVAYRSIRMRIPIKSLLITLGPSLHWLTIKFAGQDGEYIEGSCSLSKSLRARDRPRPDDGPRYCGIRQVR